VNWEMLSGNPNAIPLLEKNLDKVDWEELSSNPNIFTYVQKEAGIVQNDNAE